MQIRDRQQYAQVLTTLGEGSESPKAWMSVVDADLLEQTLLRVAARTGRMSRILEWGSGLSTLTFSRSLADAGREFMWLTLEHNREFMDEHVRPGLGLWERSVVVYRESQDTTSLNLGDACDQPGLVALVYDGGRLTPAEPGCEAHRHVNLDAYVDDPGRLGLSFDAIFVDGRKRRRTLLEARRLLAHGGVVLLHDAFRRHYQCAWNDYPAWRRIGEELWIGAADEAAITAVLPA